MKRTVVLTGTLSILLLVVAAAFSLTSHPLQAATDTATPRLITVTGDADVKVVPDEVLILFGVETWDTNLGVARSQNDERVKLMMALTRNYGIDAKYVQTDQISVEPRYKDDFTRTTFVGFFVRKTIAITLKDVSKFESLLAEALNGGATHIYDVQFRTTELRKYRDQARSLAIQAAQEKAVAMAGGLGQKVNRPHDIREDSSNWWSPYNSHWGGGGMTQNVVQNAGGSGSVSDTTTVALGQITVNARVTVSFELD